MAFISDEKLTSDGRRFYEVRVSRGKGKGQINRRFFPENGWSKDTIKRKLNKFANELENAVEAGTIINRSERKKQLAEEEVSRAMLKTVKQYGESVFMAAKSITLSETSRSAYQSNLEIHVYPIIGDLLLIDVTPSIIQKLLLDFQKNHAHASCVKLYNIINGLFSMAYLDDSISTDVMRKVKRPAPKKGETGKDESDKALTVESLAYVFSCIEKEPLKWQAFIHLAADTGCRRGEICGIEWKDIDWKNGIITIRQNVQYTPGKGVYITSPKNGKKRRVDIGEDTMAILRQWKREQALEYICPFIFSPEKSNQNKHRTDVEHKKREKPAQLEKNPMNPQSPTAYFRDLRTRYNIPNFHPHMLRHTSASISLTHGGDIASVSARLGHSDTAVTLRMYAHANEESIRRAGQAVRDALKAVNGNT